MLVTVTPRKTDPFAVATASDYREEEKEEKGEAGLGLGLGLGLPACMGGLETRSVAGKEEEDGHGRTNQFNPGIHENARPPPLVCDVGND